jgi:Amt family ammonium transporter
MLTSTALVYMMTPALACFYGGLVESKNFFNQLFLSIVCMGIVPVQWCLVGYSFTFGPGNAVFGSFNYAVLRSADLVNLYGENVDELNASTIALLAYAAYQCAFAVITPALISGAVVGRMKLIPYMLFIFLWSTFCYNPLARWIFSPQGWLNQ